MKNIVTKVLMVLALALGQQTMGTDLSLGFNGDVEGTVVTQTTLDSEKPAGPKKRVKRRKKTRDEIEQDKEARKAEKQRKKEQRERDLETRRQEKEIQRQQPRTPEQTRAKRYNRHSNKAQKAATIDSGKMELDTDVTIEPAPYKHGAQQQPARLMVSARDRKQQKLHPHYPRAQKIAQTRARKKQHNVAHAQKKHGKHTKAHRQLAHARRGTKHKSRYMTLAKQLTLQKKQLEVEVEKTRLERERLELERKKVEFGLTSV